MSTQAYFFVTVGNRGETTRLVRPLKVPGWPSIGTEVRFGENDDAINIEIDSIYFDAAWNTFEIQGKPIRPEHVGLSTSATLLAAMLEDGWEATEGQMSKPPIPEIVVLCGSTRFYAEFVEANRSLTMQGKIVLSVGFFGNATANVHGSKHLKPGDKERLDELHKRKIDLADSVFVINVDGYIGDSTRSEIAYATAKNKPVAYLEPVSK